MEKSLFESEMIQLEWEKGVTQSLQSKAVNGGNAVWKQEDGPIMVESEETSNLNMCMRCDSP